MNAPDKTRIFILQVWQKVQNKVPLLGLEKTIAKVIAIHPEYSAILNTKNILAEQFSPEQNPFYHIGLHIALEEQLMTDRPEGIQKLYAQLSEKFIEPHDLQHQILACLHSRLIAAEAHQQMPDQSLYLQCVQKLL